MPLIGKLRERVLEMRIVILHQQTADDAVADELDIRAQCEAVRESLVRLGHEVFTLACSLNLAEMANRLRALKPALVFNLVESLGGTDQLIATVPALLETQGIPFTGASSQALALTSNKLIAKRQLLAAKLATPPWVEITRGEPIAGGVNGNTQWPRLWIRKPVSEHASLGMTDEAVFAAANIAEVGDAVVHWQATLKRACFGEAFMAGREFNLALLQTHDGVRVLPPAEIDFRQYPADRPQIVGYAAKWQEDATEFAATPRTFDFPMSDVPLLEALRRTALACWQLFDLSGYCRVDFRIDSDGLPWILEVNANPCLTPGSGFAAAIEQAGLNYHEAVGQIVQAAFKNGSTEFSAKVSDDRS